MTPIIASLLCATVCSATLIMSTVASFAAPGAVVATAFGAAQRSDTATMVQYRERFEGRRGRNDRGDRRGDNLALGIGAAIIGGIVLSEAARNEHRRSHGSDWQRCADTYRSFDPGTGLYTGYDGERHTCPYLR